VVDKAKVVFCAPASWPTLPMTASLELSRFFTGLRTSNPERLGTYFVAPLDRSNPVDRARNSMIKWALVAVPDCTHICLLDLDQIYPDGMLDALLAQDKDIVGPLAFFKSRRMKNKPLAQGTDKNGVAHPIPVFNDDFSLKTECVEADILGLGGLLVRREVFETIDYPWFSYPQDGRRGISDGVSHDITFCDNAKAAGYTLNVLPSCVSGHIAEDIITEEYWRYHQMNVQNGNIIDAIQPRPESTSYMEYGEEFFTKQAGHFDNDDVFLNTWAVTRECAERVGMTSGTVLDYGAGNCKYEMAVMGVLTDDQDGPGDWQCTSYDPMPYPQSEFGAVGVEALAHDYDIIFCSEVMEHLESEEEAAAILDQWHTMSPRLLVTTINQRSHQDICPTHFLMRTRGWWIDFFATHGWAYDIELTNVATGKDRYELEYFIFRPKQNSKAVIWDDSSELTLLKGCADDTCYAGAHA